MSKSTAKPGFTRKPAKRAKRQVENPEFVAFARRILWAYARRVGAGDIEALTSMTVLAAEIDLVVREAVQGLRRFGYPWTDIAARMGVSRQAVQMHYGDPSERGALDRRLLDAGLGVTLDVLVAVFADHCRGVPAQFTCGGCGYVFDPSDVDSDCPTNALVRPILQRRRSERPSALKPLTPEQMDELQGKHRSNGNRIAAGTKAETGELFDAAPYRRGPNTGLDPTPRRRSR